MEVICIMDFEYGSQHRLHRTSNRIHLDLHTNALKLYVFGEASNLKPESSNGSHKATQLPSLIISALMLVFSTIGCENLWRPAVTRLYVLRCECDAVEVLEGTLEIVRRLGPAARTTTQKRLSVCPEMAVSDSDTQT